MLVGYARVSSRGQSLDVQKDRLAMCDEIYEETASATRYDRPQLQACLNYVRKDDILIVTRPDRLARSTIHLCQIAQVLDQKKGQLRYWIRILIQVMPLGAWSSICSGLLPSLKRSCELSANWRGF